MTPRKELLWASMLLLALTTSGAARAGDAGTLDDDFDDGIVAPIYNDVCLSGGAESSGSYRFPGTTLGCALAFGPFPAAIIEVLEPALVVPGNVIEAEFRLDRIPQINPGDPGGELAGVGLNPAANTALGLNFFMQRLPSELVVRLFDPESAVVIAEALVSATPDADPSLTSADTIELRLVLGPTTVGALFPTGSYRLCEAKSCLGDQDPPFTPLETLPDMGGTDSIALQDAARLTLQGLALPGTSQAFALERLTVPEPTSPALVVAAVAVLAIMRRRSPRQRPDRLG